MIEQVERIFSAKPIFCNKWNDGRPLASTETRYPSGAIPVVFRVHEGTERNL